MGNIVQKLKDLLNFKKETRMIILGFDGVGKTTILYRLKLGKTIEASPTIGFNVETVRYKKLTLILWDIGRQSQIKKLWKHYYVNTNALIFVIDTSSPENLNLAKEEFDSLIAAEELRDLPILFYANKQDIGTLTVEEIIEKFEMKTWNRLWHVQACVATNGTGLYEGLDWLNKTLN